MHERYREIYERFEKCFPTEKYNVIDWYPSTRNEIVIRFKSGEVMYFSGNNDRFGYIDRGDSEEFVEELPDVELRRLFSNKLVRLMQANYMNQRQLSAASGISFVSINHYTTGKRLPDYKNLLRICRALGCSVSELTYFE